MNVVERLIDVGFADFKHLRKDKRDGKRRLAWVGIINDNISSITLVEDDNHWLVDAISPYDERLFALLRSMDLDGLINYIEGIRGN